MHLIVLYIILAALLLMNLVPVGVDSGLAGAVFFLSARAGPLSIGSLPKNKRAETPRQRDARHARKAEKKAKREAKAKAKRVKNPFGPDTVRELVMMGLHTLGRMRRHLSVDYILLRWTAGAGNPYDAAMQYGAVCAAIGTLTPFLERALRIRERETEVNVRFDIAKPEVEARILLTLRVWEITWVGLAFGWEYLRWKLSNRRKTRDSERKNGNGE